MQSLVQRLPQSYSAIAHGIPSLVVVLHAHTQALRLMVTTTAWSRATTTTSGGVGRYTHDDAAGSKLSSSLVAWRPDPPPGVLAAAGMPPPPLWPVPGGLEPDRYGRGHDGYRQQDVADRAAVADPAAVAATAAAMAVSASAAPRSAKPRGWSGDPPSLPLPLDLSAAASPHSPTIYGSHGVSSAATVPVGSARAMIAGAKGAVAAAAAGDGEYLADLDDWVVGIIPNISEVAYKNIYIYI